MITRPAPRLLRVSLRKRAPIAAPITRHFSTTPENKAKNRVYTPVRRYDDFSSYLQLSTSSRTPLLTLWTASYCATCKTVSPLLQELIEAGVGEEEGGVSFCEVEYDTPDVMDSGLGMTYMITSLPTLLSFDRGEAQTGTKVVDPKKLTDKEWMKEWIRTEARRRGQGGGGTGLYGGGTGLLGGLFGNTK
ncbi:Thioredoxin-like protein [Venustampulla echinocandica]|uniref:Thioredoxin-like protein n=1 Tax=Venustampulla echinocandica TaxID=2656787 RepID=A0A370TBK1_9HELO|nr:Thioredoxin-like protein [Venustampulla echinocandica]RDL31419.1 Thioredoxin-like protein [Venustampulla echinocandica]